MAGSGRRTRPYQRRRRRPVAVVVAVLAVMALATWVTVLVNVSGPAGSASCPPPVAGAPPPGEVLAADALDAVAPVAPATTRVRVFNAGGQRGQANLVGAQLGDLGFTEVAPPANDPFYPDENLECVGQLRFGAAGERAASTVALVLPCVELVRDTREDDTVDVVVGTAFGDLNPSEAAQDALDQLSGSTDGDDGSANAAQDGGPPQQEPTVDAAVLEEARTGIC
jgi:hypothetical protein